jgi:hypothetical protein
MGFLIFLFWYLIIGFVFFRVWAWRCKPQEVARYRTQPSVWKMRGCHGIEEGFSMPDEPNWEVKNAAIASLCFGPFFAFASFFRYTYILLSKLANKVANSVIPKDQGKPDGQKQA